MHSIFKRTFAALLVGLTIMTSTTTVLAKDNEVDIDFSDKSVQKIMTSGIDDLNVQLNDLYKEVGKELNIDYLYVKIIHLIAGGKAVYADKRPNIYTDSTVDTLSGPFEIDGSKQSINKKAPWAYCPDSSINRPSKYYLPDAAYNTTADIVKIMNTRANIDRGTMQPYFDALKKEVKTNILFTEAILAYKCTDASIVNSFYRVYEKLLYDKDTYENVLQYNENKEFVFKEKYRQILVDNGISDKKLIDTLSTILSFDKNLAACDNPDQIKEEFVVPYKMGYTSRENMMIAAMSVVGKVRYVWGGGHLSTGNLNGINPMWKEFNDTYGKQTGEDGYLECIKPNISWCPIHKEEENANGCLLDSDTVYSAEEYLNLNKEIKDSTSNTDKYDTLFSDITYLEHGITAHRLDGLDCSGYTSWVYNQIDKTREYDGGAGNFVGLNELQVITDIQSLLPGDVFSWPAHIVMIVGKVKDNSTAYVMIEASPNTVKFGVLYCGDTDREDIANGLNIAREANELIGNLATSERTNAYNINSVSYMVDYIATDEYGNEVLMSGIGEENLGTFGRINKPFIDENINLPDTEKLIIEMTAKEIIQHTLKKLPDDYISGLTDYKDNIFNTFDLHDTIQMPELMTSDLNQSNEIEKLASDIS